MKGISAFELFIGFSKVVKELLRKIQRGRQYMHISSGVEEMKNK